MRMNVQALLLLLIFASLAVLLLLGYRRDRRHLLKLRSCADKAFSELVVASTEERLVFRGCEAVVQKREETGGLRGVFEHPASLSVSIWATNKHGELFLFRWFSKSPTPYFRHFPSPQREAVVASNPSFQRTPHGAAEVKR